MALPLTKPLKDTGQSVIQDFSNNLTENITQTERSQIRERLRVINHRDKNETSMSVEFWRYITKAVMAL